MLINSPVHQLPKRSRLLGEASSPSFVEALDPSTGSATATVAVKDAVTLHASPFSSQFAIASAEKFGPGSVKIASPGQPHAFVEANVPARYHSQATFAANGSRVAFSDKENVWGVDAQTGKVLFHRRTSAEQALLTSDGSGLVLLGSGGLQLLDAASGKSLGGQEMRVDKAAIAHDGSLLVVSEGRLLSLERNKVPGGQPFAPSWTSQVLTAHPDAPATRLGAPSLSPDGERIAISNEAGLMLLDAATGKVLDRVEGPLSGPSGQSGPAWSKDGKLLAVLERGQGFARDSLRVLDSATLRTVTSVPADPREIQSFAFDNQGRLSVTLRDRYSSEDQIALSFNPQNGENVAQVIAGAAPLVLDGDGHVLASRTPSPALVENLSAREWVERFRQRAEQARSADNTMADQDPRLGFVSSQFQQGDRQVSVDWNHTGFLSVSEKAPEKQFAFEIGAESRTLSTTVRRTPARAMYDGLWKSTIDLATESLLEEQYSQEYRLSPN